MHLCIHGRTCEDHQQYLKNPYGYIQWCLTSFGKTRIWFNTVTCEWDCDSVSFLGFVVIWEVNKLQPFKVGSKIRIKSPNTKQMLKCYIGMVIYIYNNRKIHTLALLSKIPGENYCENGQMSNKRCSRRIKKINQRNKVIV